MSGMPPADPGLHYVQTTRTARFYTLGPDAPVAEQWLVLHGYGQLAQYFIRHFRPLDDGTRRIAAPEALSRFYLDGRYSRVGATWMTREDRHLEIQDQATYLDRVWAQLSEVQQDRPCRRILFGFSQGAATAWRWALHQRVPFDAIVLWGGTIPADRVDADALRGTQIVLAYGDEDELVTPARMAEVRAVLHEAGVPFQEMPYRGAHTVPEAALHDLQHLLADSR